MVLRCSDVRKTYGAFAALDGVSVAVERGEILGIAGPNGAGKTTLFDILSGRTPPDTGRVFLDERDVSGRPAHVRARLGLARTFQAPLVPAALTMGETLEAARRAWAPSPDRTEVDRACELAGLAVDPAQLTGALDTLGRRKLLLACLLLRRPGVLLLDEPASGLLTDEIAEIDAIIRHVRDATGAAVMIVEHRLELLFSVASRVIVMDAGRAIAEGPPSTVFADPKVHEAYFETPRGTRAASPTVPA